MKGIDNMANQDLFFDITKQGTEQEKQQYIISRVGDGGLKAITITVWSNGKPYNLTDLTPVFEGVKPDGEKIIDTTGGIVLDPRNGVFRYVFPQQASTAEGKYEQAFFKLKRGEQTDSTLEVQITVLKNRVEFGINSESYFTEYQKILNKLTEVVEGGIEKLNEKTSLTEEKIDGQASVAKALKLQLDTIKSAIESSELISKGDFKTLTDGLNEQVNSFIETVETKQTKMQSQVEKLQERKFEAGVEPGVLKNVSSITKSNTYYYNDSTKELPTRNDNNANGFIQSFMKDANNGMITILGTGYAIEKYKGKLYNRWVTSVPVRLWTGNAKKGSTIKLRGNVHKFSELILHVGYYSKRNAVETVTIPNNGNKFYLNTCGLIANNGKFKNGLLEEITILVKDDTHLAIESTLITKGNEDATDSDAYITAVYGVN